MAVIQIPVEALDENCAGCQCISLRKETVYGGLDAAYYLYSCEHLHMCTFIRNRIIRNEKNNDKEKNDNDRKDNP